MWDCNSTAVDVSDRRDGLVRMPWGDYGEEEQSATLAPTVIAGATSENTQKAKEFINGLSADGGKVATCCAVGGNVATCCAALPDLSGLLYNLSLLSS